MTPRKHMPMRFELEIAPLNIDQTLGCGQAFRWRRGQDGSWSGPLGNQLVMLRQEGSTVHVYSRPGRRGLDRAIAEYLRAHDDIRKIQKTLGRDSKIASGIAKLKGLRIVKMDEWECLVSFVLATYANIPRITKMIETLARTYGERIADDTYSFPTQRGLREASVAELARHGLGYRASYLHEICKEVDDRALAKLRNLKYEELRAKLKELPGIGDKVADCVCLFGFGRLESFPIDVWIERSLGRLYEVRGSYKTLREFAEERFGSHAGYAQEYLYYNERLHAKSGACLFSKE